jgi:hypothetical protein
MMEIPKELNNEIWEYCRANNITNIDDFTLRLLKQGFTSEKFGSTPMIKTIEKEVEKIVEVPVEKIVEKIVEVPVNMVDTELTENVKKYMELYNTCQSELTKALSLNETLTKELEVEKQKNKKDIYGEG